MMNVKGSANQVVQQIVQALEEHYPHHPYHGLLGGNTGTALFFAYYYQLTGDEKLLEKSYQIIEHSLQSIADSSLHASHCSGLAGVGWALLHLAEMGYIEANDLDSTFSDIDTILSKELRTDLANGQTDFLHQGLGIALYFLSRLPSGFAGEQLQFLVKQLWEHRIILDRGISWKDQFSTISQTTPGRDLFNLGLAHGVPAIITILSKIYKAGIEKELCHTMINDSIQWLLSTKNNDSSPTISLYPVLIDAKGNTAGDRHSRLGWCYGDLGIASMYLNVGINTQNQQYVSISEEMFMHIARNRDIQNGSVHDACICHGSSGIALMLQQSYKAFGNSLLQQRSNFWWEHSLQQNTWPDGAAGYKFYHHPNYTTNFNLLEGVSGIGLSLIHCLEPSLSANWAGALLIN